MSHAAVSRRSAQRGAPVCLMYRCLRLSHAASCNAWRLDLALNLPLPHRLIHGGVVEVVVVFVGLLSVARSCQTSLSATARACLPDVQVSETVSCSQLQCLVAGSSA